MNSKKKFPARGLKKIHVKDMILFAIRYLPQLDKLTLEKFLELVDAEESTYGYVSAKELAGKMQLLLEHIPETCPHSLETMAALLDVQLQNPRATAKLLHMGIFIGETVQKVPLRLRHI